MPGIIVTLSGNARPFERELARAEAIAFGWNKNIQKQQAASMVVNKRMAADMAAFKASVDSARGNSMMSEKESMAKDEAIRLAEVEAVTRSNMARRLWRQRKSDAKAQAAELAAVELAAQVDTASRSNMARRLWRQRGESRAARVAEEIAANALVARGYGAAAHDPNGGHLKGGSLTGIIRESMVIVRELAQGRGSGRVAGSVTLLAQYMGLLGKVVKSTAQEQVIYSIAQSKLAQSMATEAEAARGTVAFSGLLKKAREQERVATEAATKAEIALQTAKVAINPLGWALIAGVAITAVLVGWAWHLHTLAVRARNLKEALDPLKKQFTELAQGRIDAAKAEQANSDWLKELAQDHKAEAEEIERKIRLLRMEADARGWGKAQTAAAEKEMLLKEKARLEKEVAEAINMEEYRFDFQNQGSFTKDFTTGEVIDAKQAADKAKKLGEIADAAEAALKTHGLVNSNEVAGYTISPYGGVPYYKTREANDTDQLTFKVGEKKFSMTMAQAKANFEKASAQAEKLAADQKLLDDALKDAKATAKEKQDALNKVNADLQTINDEQKAGTYGGSGGRRPEVTARERVGLGGAQTEVNLVDIGKQQLAQTKTMNEQIKQIATSVANLSADIGGLQ